MISLAPKIILILALSVGLSGSSIPTSPSTSPNVILIIADQMRGDAISALGHPNIRTPHLDRMAEDGVLFTNYFTNNPVCVPSRMSMFSGLYPHEHGALSNKGPKTRFSSEQGTLLGYFHDNGYRLGWFGKDNHTFDRAVLDSLLDANSSRRREGFRAYGTHTSPHWASTSPWPMEDLFAYKTTTDVIDFISEEQASPFFAVLSLFDPHPPYFAPADYVAHYPIDDIVLPEYTEPSHLGELLAHHKQAMLFDVLTESDLKNTMAHYYAAIEWGVDYQVGRVLDTLASLDLKDNTIVLFTSEHGDFMGEYGMVRKGMFLYDALLHVPFIWYAPGHIQQGLVTDALTHSVDILPSLIELTGGIPYENSGESLIQILKGASREAKPDRTIFASAGYTPIPATYFDAPETPYFTQESTHARAFHSRILDLQTRPSSRMIMARTKEWKLIMSETHPPELYRVHDNLREKENLINTPEHSAIQAELTFLARQTWDWTN